MRRPPGSTLFPYATLFRSDRHVPELRDDRVAGLRERLRAHRVGLNEDRLPAGLLDGTHPLRSDRKSTRLNSSHANISYAVFCLKKKKLHNSPHPPTSLSFF